MQYGRDIKGEIQITSQMLLLTGYPKVIVI